MHIKTELKKATLGHQAGTAKAKEALSLEIESYPGEETLVFLAIREDNYYKSVVVKISELKEVVAML